MLGNPAVIGDLKALADAGLTLDVANPNPRLMESVVRVTDRVPSLRVVLDHVPQMDPAEARGESAGIGEAAAGLCERVVGAAAGGRAGAGGFGVLQAAAGRDCSGYSGRTGWCTGQDWPNSDNWGQYPLVLRHREGVLHGEGAGDRREVLLAKLGGGVPVGEARGESAVVGQACVRRNSSSSS